jgi:prolipoprotein diacylglyceryltransferase
LPEILQLGPFLIKTSWLFMGIGGVLGYFVMKKRLDGTSFPHQAILDLFTTAIMIVVILWKLGPFIFAPSQLWDSPLSILFVTGTAKHLWLGVIIALVYTYIKTKRVGIPFTVVLDLLPYGFLTLSVIYHLFIWQYGSPASIPWGISIQDSPYTYHPINLYEVLVSLSLLLWLWTRSKANLGQGLIFSSFLTFYGAGQMVVSFFEPQTATLLGLPIEQWVYLSMLIIGSVIPYGLNRYEKNV